VTFPQGLSRIDYLLLTKRSDGRAAQPASSAMISRAIVRRTGAILYLSFGSHNSLW